MTNKPKREKKLREYRVVFKDGSEITFQAVGLKEAENAVRDMQKDPEELIELHSSPIECEQVKYEQECQTTKYTEEEINNLCGTHVEYYSGYLSVKVIGVYPTLDEDVKKDLNKIGQALQENEKAYMHIEDVIIINKDGEGTKGTMVRFYKQSDKNTIDISVFLEVAKRTLMALSKHVRRQQEQEFCENLIHSWFRAICQDPNNFPEEDA